MAADTKPNSRRSGTPPRKKSASGRKPAQSKRSARKRPSGAARTTASAKQRRIPASNTAAVRTSPYSEVAVRKSAAVSVRTHKKRRKAHQGILAGGVIGDIRKPWDSSLLLITILLLVCGLIALFSASYPTGYYNDSDKIGPMYYVIRQGGCAIIGLAAMLFLSAFDYHRYHRFKKIIYGAAVLLLFAVLTPLGTTLNNSRRWIFGFQPSELAKLAIIILLASEISLHPDSVKSIKGLAKYLLIVAVVCGLLYKEPHMSAIMIICIIALTICFVGGMKLIWLIPAVAGGGALAVLGYFTLGHVSKRASVWPNPFVDARGDGYQAVQSFIAIGSGGLFGRGLGDSRQKFLYLPEPMNDFIFSVVCEELGFIGAVIFLVMFGYFIYHGYKISMRASDRFGCLLGVGITTQFAFQIMLNLAVVSGLCPVTGASLPFFSYGGTALMMQLAEVGILLNISRHIPPSRARGKP